MQNILIANAELAFAYKSFRIQSEYKIMTLRRGQIYDDINYTGQNLEDANFEDNILRHHIIYLEIVKILITLMGSLHVSILNLKKVQLK